MCTHDAMILGQDFTAKQVAGNAVGMLNTSTSTDGAPAISARDRPARHQSPTALPRRASTRSRREDWPPAAAAASEPPPFAPPSLSHCPVLLHNREAKEGTHAAQRTPGLLCH